MSWPALQFEHLVAAVTMGWLAFAWFCWSSGLRPTGDGSRRNPAWNWLAGAALLGALEFAAWLVLLITAHRLFLTIRRARIDRRAPPPH